MSILQKPLYIITIGMFYPNTFPDSQKSAMPIRTVPPSDLVFMAKRKVGIATIISGLRRSRWRGLPAVMREGKIKALKMAAGIKSSHASSHKGSSFLERKRRGRRRGK